MNFKIGLGEGSTQCEAKLVSLVDRSHGCCLSELDMLNCSEIKMTLAMMRR